MKVISTPLRVECPNGGFVSERYLLAADAMGFGMTRTTIPVGPAQHWHYKNHLEACLCISGFAQLTNLATGERHTIQPGVLYALDRHDDHSFQAFEETVLICCFNPPLKGHEVHRKDGSYE